MHLLIKPLEIKVEKHSKSNKSAEKIKNSYLQKRWEQFRVMTKVKAMKAGIFKPTKRVWLANRYKLIDTSILANSISKFSHSLQIM